MANAQLTREARRQARGVSLMGLSEQRLKAGRMRLPGAVRGSKCRARPPGVWGRGSREGQRQRLSSQGSNHGAWLRLPTGPSAQDSRSGRGPCQSHPLASRDTGHPQPTQWNYSSGTGHPDKLCMRRKRPPRRAQQGSKDRGCSRESSGISP